MVVTSVLAKIGSDGRSTFAGWGYAAKSFVRCFGLKDHRTHQDTGLLVAQKHCDVIAVEATRLTNEEESLVVSCGVLQRSCLITVHVGIY